jgi:hypothetical protein
MLLMPSLHVTFLKHFENMPANRGMQVCRHVVCRSPDADTRIAGFSSVSQLSWFSFFCYFKPMMDLIINLFHWQALFLKIITTFAQFADARHEPSRKISYARVNKRVIMAVVI